MPFSRKKWITFFSISVVLIVILAGVSIFIVNSGPLPKFLSQQQVAQITGYNFSQTTISSTNSHQFAGELMEYSAYFVVPSTLQSLTVLILHFNTSKIASNFYWTLTSPEVNSSSAIVNASFKGSVYSYLYDPMTNLTYGLIFNGWGVDRSYVFSIFGPSLVISNKSMVSLIDAQIEAMY